MDIYCTAPCKYIFCISYCIALPSLIGTLVLFTLLCYLTALYVTREMAVEDGLGPMLFALKMVEVAMSQGMWATL